MSILNKVKRGPVTRPQKVVIYGPESVGKTTLAASAPAPLYIDTEGGTAQLDVARIDAASWEDVLGTVRELARDPSGFGTVILDTVDWAEKLAVDAVVAAANKPSIRGIEDFGYGKGYTFLAEEFTRLLLALEDLPLHKILLAHSKVVRFEPPDVGTGWDRYELKLSKTVMPLVKEWADALLFVQFDQRVRESDSGRVKGIGGKERFIHTVHSAAFDAKNRHGLAERLPLAWASIASLFPALEAAGVAAVPQQRPNDDPVMAFAVGVDGYANDVMEFLRRRGVVGQDATLDDVPADYARRALKRMPEFMATVQAALKQEVA